MYEIICEACNTHDEDGVYITVLAYPDKPDTEAYRTVGLCCRCAAKALKSFIEHSTTDSFEAAKILSHIGGDE